MNTVSVGKPFQNLENKVLETFENRIIVLLLEFPKQNIFIYSL